jgi:hypothetical protein
MITMRRQLLGLGLMAASSLLAMQAAHAMSGPSAIQIDGGPLGALQISGGVDGYGIYVSNTAGNEQPLSADVANGLVELQKSDGILQFTIEVGSNGGAVTLGAPGFQGDGHISQTSISTFTTGPLYAGYVTVAPSNLPITISAGQIGSLEGYESGIDWNNANQLTTEIFYVQNSQSRGVSANYSSGPVSLTLTFGDGYDTGVWNFLQALLTYTINPTNNVSVYYAGNLGRTGLAATIYGGGTVGGYGPEYVNSQMGGVYYSYTMGNLNLVPEAQYQYAKADAQIGLSKPTYNFGAALFADYSLSSTSPYSIGAWAEYFTSHSSAADATAWFIGPDAEGIGASITPTWQYKDLFSRVDAGYVYLLNNKASDGTKYGYGTSNGHGEFIGTLEAGLLF